MAAQYLLALMLLATPAPACGASSAAEACIDAIAEAWSRADIRQAGADAGFLLDREAARDGTMLDVGGHLAFMAALSEYSRERTHMARYWLWVARRHQEVCGSRLPAPQEAVIDMHAARPGNSLVIDRLIRRSPFLADVLHCQSSGTVSLSSDSVSAPGSEYAVAIFGYASDNRADLAYVGRPYRERRPARPELVYEYPRGSVSPLLPSLTEDAARNGYAALDGAVLTFSPCTWVYFGEPGPFEEVCRADQ